jgi:Family of unknown function (DUF6101)
MILVRPGKPGVGEFEASNMRSGGKPAGSSRALRLDPFALPVRYAAEDARADGHERDIEICRDRVILRRAVCGIRMAVKMPVSAFLGVALHVLPPQGETQAAVALVLEHNDPSLRLPLYVSPDTDDLLAQWQSWSQVLGVPQLVGEIDGEVREAFAHLGMVQVADPFVRRRRRNALWRRRPFFLMRRRPGCAISAGTRVHRDEREIIARN